MWDNIAKLFSKLYVYIAIAKDWNEVLIDLSDSATLLKVWTDLRSLCLILSTCLSKTYHCIPEASDGPSYYIS